jgi:hypothetical protein
MLANSEAVHGILEYVTHLNTEQEILLRVTPVNPLAVLGYFQSWVKEDEDMLVVVEMMK